MSTEDEILSHLVSVLHRRDHDRNGRIEVDVPVRTQVDSVEQVELRFVAEELAGDEISPDLWQTIESLSDLARWIAVIRSRVTE